MQMVKFADDAYSIIPAVNANSRQSKLENVQLWSRANNLKVNPGKYVEMVFVDIRMRKLAQQTPTPLPNIARVSTM